MRLLLLLKKGLVPPPGRSASVANGSSVSQPRGIEDQGAELSSDRSGRSSLLACVARFPMIVNALLSQQKDGMPDEGES